MKRDQNQFQIQGQIRQFDKLHRFDKHDSDSDPQSLPSMASRGVAEANRINSGADFKLTKKELARRLGVSVSSLYYRRKREDIDREVKNQIESVLAEHPAYGHKRIALTLKLNKKRILRVMKKYGIKPYRRRSRKCLKRRDLGKPKAQYPNLIKEMFDKGGKGLEISHPELVWVSDFTYIKYKERFIYLATIMDLYTREVVGANISRFHSKELVLGALEDALSRYHKPEIIHSDQGSEYDSETYTSFLNSLGIKISMSRKASPWENGYQESFYSHFKGEFGDVNRFEDIAELIEQIYHDIWYYNHRRIHSSLKTTPFKFRESYCSKLGT